MKLGLQVLLEDPTLKKQLIGQRLAIVGHPASMVISPSGDFVHSMDALKSDSELQLCSAFAPQHGIKGEKQDNMMESQDTIDPVYHIPVFSLYGEVRRPTPKMLDTFDTVLFDIQDIGTRVYTFLTTLRYMLEACAEHQKAIWVLDRPNPVGRPVEGSLLDAVGWSSFVGAAELPMRHGLTLAEAAKWLVKKYKIQAPLKTIPLQNYDIHAAPGYGWPLGEWPWVNPSPNASNLSMARCYPGSVLLEGTHLSEGRGTTHPLEVLGAPDLNGTLVLKEMEKLAPQWMQGCRLRPCHFQPTFQKHVGKICSGFQIHVDDTAYQHEVFKPYRLIALALKAIRGLRPNYPIWRDFHYEYEKDRLAIDLINGGPSLRQWVDDPNATPQDFEKTLQISENSWEKEREEFLLY